VTNAHVQSNRNSVKVNVKLISYKVKETAFVSGSLAYLCAQIRLKLKLKQVLVQVATACTWSVK